MIKLKTQEKFLLVLFTLWYLLSVQLVGQQLINFEGNSIVEGNIFKTEEIMIIFLNSLIMIFSVIFLLFQGFIYRFILLLFKAKKFPSVFTSFFYLIIGYLPFSITIITVYFTKSEILYDLATNYYLKILFTIIVNTVYVMIITRKGFLEHKKALIFWVFLMLINTMILLVN